jgi:hypothetical protein
MISKDFRFFSFSYTLDRDDLAKEYITNDIMLEWGNYVVMGQ